MIFAFAEKTKLLSRASWVGMGEDQEFSFGFVTHPGGNVK